MQKLLLSLILAISFLSADSILLLKKGWQLIGASENITDMSKFNSSKVEQVLRFDASTQSWLGYSPDKTIQSKMSDKGIATLQSLKKWHGFWVKSIEDWGLVLDNSSLSQEPNDNKSADIVMLKKGWNLISLPIDSVVSADIFKDFTLWKYNNNRDWEFFDNTQSESNFPRLGHIKNSDGIWIKAPKDTNISIMSEASKLHNFSTNSELEAYIKEMATLNNRPYWGIEPLVMQDFIPINTIANGVETAPKSSDEATNITNTNLQEVGVDEADIVKHNGTNIFYKVNDREIYITSFTNLVANSKLPLNKIKIDDNQTILDMYLVDNKLIVLSNLYTPSNSYQSKEPSIAVDIIMPYYQSKPKLVIDIFDIRSITNIPLLAKHKIDGSIITSRVVDKNLYLVSQFNPQIKITYPKISIVPSTICEDYLSGSYSTQYNYSDYAPCYEIQKDYERDSYYKYDYQNPNIEVVELLPNIDSNSVSKPLVIAKKLYAPNKLKQDTTITSISLFNLDSNKYLQTSSIIGSTNIQYASSKALYLLSTQYPYYYDFNNYKERSTIYKFGFDDNLSYRGVGDVYGHALNQFAMSEYNDILRIATTEGFSWGSRGTNNSIYTLKEELNTLNIQGLLTGLGREGESIKSVRFMGKRGYIVTFRQSDPLYTIDLSNPTTPQKAGELHINGYSDYLHPIGEDRLLGIGRDATETGRVQGVKIELFDVSDLNNPISRDSIVLADNTSSTISYNHKALAYRSSDNLFAFPYQYSSTTSYLGLYQVKDSKLIDYQDMKITNYSWSEKRGLIFDINGITYISFFANDTVITETLKEK